MHVKAHTRYDHGKRYLDLSVFFGTNMLLTRDWWLSRFYFSYTGTERISIHWTNDYVLYKGYPVYCHPYKYVNVNIHDCDYNCEAAICGLPVVEDKLLPQITEHFQPLMSIARNVAAHKAPAAILMGYIEDKLPEPWSFLATDQPLRFFQALCPLVPIRFNEESEYESFSSDRSVP